jgi:hypothetical protein
MYCFIYVFWFVFPVPINSVVLMLDNLQDLLEEDLGSPSSKASEPLINSTYYFFLALFTNYFMHKKMSHSMFTFHIISCDIRLRFCV